MRISVHISLPNNFDDVDVIVEVGPDAHRTKEYEPIAETMSPDTIARLVGDKRGTEAVFAVINPSKLAAKVGVTRAAASYWKKQCEVPAERLGDVARATGIAPNIIRPDLFPTEAVT